MLGVLGGMGPLATADFYAKLIRATPAGDDQAHVPALIYSATQIPGRVAAIRGLGESPLPQLRAALNVLQHAGAECIVMPCNTAHYWYDDLLTDLHVPFIHIADAAVLSLQRRCPTASVVGILATDATLELGMYQQRLIANGYEARVLSGVSYQSLVRPAIDAVKASDVVAAAPLVVRAADELFAGGAQVVVLACTELPIAWDTAKQPPQAAVVDATAALAEAAVGWWRKQQQRGIGSATTLSSASVIAV